MGNMTRTQKFDDKMRDSLGSANYVSFKSNVPSSKINLNNSSPDFKKANSSSRVLESPEDGLPDTAQYNEGRT